jgi:hypothetical protein
VIDLDAIRSAAGGQRGEDQKRLAVTGLEVVGTLLRKNTDYGSSAWQVPILAPRMTPREAIQCRMSDKVARLAKLLTGDQAAVEESIEDTMRDLAGYSILWLGCPDREAVT